MKTILISFCLFKRGFWKRLLLPLQVPTLSLQVNLFTLSRHTTFFFSLCFGFVLDLIIIKPFWVSFISPFWIWVSASASGFAFFQFSFICDLLHIWVLPILFIAFEFYNGYLSVYCYKLVCQIL